MEYPFRISGRHRRFEAGLIPPNLNLDLVLGRTEGQKSLRNVKEAEKRRNPGECPQFESCIAAFEGWLMASVGRS
jgi:hypothetical protein